MSSQCNFSFKYYTSIITAPCHPEPVRLRYPHFRYIFKTEGGGEERKWGRGRWGKYLAVQISLPNMANSISSNV